jgi:hypothetical protein
MSSPSSLVLRLATATIAVTLAHRGGAQTLRPTAPIERLPAVQAPVAPNGGAPRFQLVLWTDGRGTVLAGLTNVTGVGGAALPSTDQVRARTQFGQPTGDLGVVLINAHANSPAAQALSHLTGCDLPACVLEIDELDPNGQVVGSHFFSGGTDPQEAANRTNELDEFSFTFQKIKVTNLVGEDSATDDWLTN